MTVSLRVFGFPLDQYLALAQEADRLGFHAIFVPDHLVAPLEYAPQYPYRETGRPRFLPDTPFADPWVMLGYLAAATTSIRLGVGVFVLPLRNAFAVAKAAATVQVLSGGRLLFGVGVGWMREEFDAVGEEFERRGSRAEEMVEVMRKLWSGEPVEHAREWLQFPLVQSSPPARPTIPLLFGGTSPIALRRAARLGDGWYGPPSPLEEAIEYRAVLTAERAAARPEASAFRMFVRVPGLATVEAALKFRDAGFADVVVDVPREIPGIDGKCEWLRGLAASLGQAGFPVGRSCRNV
jgi:probable F420-dependent oxidoreductase